MENKEEIVEKLKDLIIVTRCGRDVSDLVYDKETVTIIFKNGYERKVNVACDSGCGIIRDVLDALD